MNKQKKSSWFIIAGVAVVILVLISGLLFFFRSLPSNQLVVENDTDSQYTITPILQSHDNAVIYRDKSIELRPAETSNIDIGFDNIRCLSIEGLGDVSVDDNSAKVSMLITDINTKPCLYMDYIGKVPPAKISISEPYLNDADGYSIRMPHYWNATQSSATQFGEGTYFRAEEVIVSPDDRRGLSIVVTDISLEDLIKRHEGVDPEYRKENPDYVGPQITNQEEFFLDGVKGKKLTGTTDDGSDINYVFVRKNNKSYIISFNDYNDTHVSMISTFKFTE